MKIKGLRTFIPSIDFDVSKAFYTDMGFEIIWENKELVEFGTKRYNFFLQDFYVKDWAENLMMQLFVEDLESLYDVCKALVEKYENTKIKPIFEADYGKTFHLIGPAGELWHMTEVTTQEEIEENKLICEDE
jgi:hypothetical protein